MTREQLLAKPGAGIVEVGERDVRITTESRGESRTYRVHGYTAAELYTIGVPAMPTPTPALAAYSDADGAANLARLAEFAVLSVVPALVQRSPLVALDIPEVWGGEGELEVVAEWATGRGARPPATITPPGGEGQRFEVATQKVRVTHGVAAPRAYLRLDVPIATATVTADTAATSSVVALSGATVVAPPGVTAPSAPAGMLQPTEANGGGRAFKAGQVVKARYEDDQWVYDTRSEYPGGIEPVGDGTFRGAEIDAPLIRWVEKLRLPPGELDAAKLLAIAHKTNEGTLRGLSPGEARCLGGYAEEVEKGGEWVVELGVEAARNVTGETLPGLEGFEPLTKNGFDYVWVGQGEDGRPDVVWVETLYASSDLAAELDALGEPV
ncbi:MAG: hypothetical protein AAF805_00210 [Planctomycetota bacterium]